MKVEFTRLADMWEKEEPKMIPSLDAWGKNGVISFPKWAKNVEWEFQREKPGVWRDWPACCRKLSVPGLFLLKASSSLQLLCQPTATLTHFQILLVLVVLPMVETNCNQ